MSVDVSVIIPVRNGAQWIGEQLDALSRQDFQGRWEVVVADNGSTDDTRALVEEMRREFPTELRVVDASGRAGASYARNQGAKASSGSQLAFCDADDHVGPGWVRAAHAGAAGGRILAGVNRAMTWPQDPRSEILNPGGILRGRTIDAFVSCNLAMTRADYFATGGFDESFPPYGCEDIELAIRSAARGLAVVGSEDMLLYFRRTEGIRATLRKVLLSGKAEIVLWHRHPALFRGQLGLRRALWRLLRTPVDLVRFRSGSDPAPRRWLVREAVTRWAHVVGSVKWRLGKYHREAILLSPDDDPLQEQRG